MVFYILAVMICLLQEIGKSRERVVNYNTIPLSNFRVMFQFVWLLRKFGKRKENIIVLNFKICCLFRTQERAIYYTQLQTSLVQALHLCCFSIILFLLPNYGIKRKKKKEKKIMQLKF